MSSTSSGPKRQSQRPKRDFPSTHGNQRSRPPKQPNNSKARPTHFLALPIGHHAELRDAVSALTSSWLAHDPPIEGLDPTIVINPRRLHLTLGVMTLASSQPSQSNHDRDADRGTTIDLAGATTLLASLTPRIRAVLANNPLRIPLGRLAIMQPDPARAHVLYVDPDLRSPDGRRLRAVCDLVHGAFKEAGFLADVRPLKLHCTILNTTFRRAQQGQRRAAERIPFSFAAFPQASGASSNLGTWAVDELQICEMGSWAPDGAYVRVAGCNLRLEP